MCCSPWLWMTIQCAWVTTASACTSCAPQHQPAPAVHHSIYSALAPLHLAPLANESGSRPLDESVRMGGSSAEPDALGPDDTLGGVAGGPPARAAGVPSPPRLWPCVCMGWWDSGMGSAAGIALATRQLLGASFPSVHGAASSCQDICNACLPTAQQLQTKLYTSVSPQRRAG